MPRAPSKSEGIFRQNYMKMKFDYRKYRFIPVSTDHDDHEFLTIDIILLSFSYKLNLTVEDGRQFTEACHDVGI